MTKIIGGHPGRHDRELLGLPFPLHHRVSFFMLASLFTNNDQVFDDWSPHHLQHVEERWSTAHLCNGWRVRGEERKNFPGIARNCNDWLIEKKIDLKRLDWSGSALGLFLGLLALVVLEKIFLVQNFFSCRYFFVLKNSSCSSCPSPCSPRSP